MNTAIGIAIGAALCTFCHPIFVLFVAIGWVALLGMRATLDNPLRHLDPSGFAEPRELR